MPAGLYVIVFIILIAFFAITGCFVSLYQTCVSKRTKNIVAHDRCMAMSWHMRNVYVRDSSERLKKLSILNSEYASKFIGDHVFRQMVPAVVPFDIRQNGLVSGCKLHIHILNKACKSMAEFRRIDAHKLLREWLAGTPVNIDFHKLHGLCSENMRLYNEYRQRVTMLETSSLSESMLERYRISKAQYIEVENVLIQNAEIKPVIYAEFVVGISYSSPQGRNRDEREQVFSIDQILMMLVEIENDKKYRQSETYRRKKARSAMTDKLRYKILKRDGYRCVICGRSAEDGVKLHVDHIIPVAKGGETVESNLQTLCEDCNWGKSDNF